MPAQTDVSGDLVIEATPDLTRSGALVGGDLVLKTNTVERARIKADGTGTGWGSVIGGSRSFAGLAYPAGLGWAAANAFAVTEIDDVLGTPRSVATVNVTPESLFDAVSTARTAPANTYNVATTGSDTTGDGSAGNPYQSKEKAFSVGNATGSPYKVVMVGGASPYFRNIAATTIGSVLPTQDVALIASGGRVITGAFDNFTARPYDGTLTNCQTLTVSTVQRILDCAHLDQYGNYVELPKVAGTDAGVGARCNATPNSWFLGTGTNGGTSGVLYVNRADQQQMTVANTRVYRPGTNCMRITTPINVYIGGATAGDGFDMEGSQGGAPLDWNTASPGVTRKVLVARDCTFKYGGGYTDTGARAVSIESINGLAAFFNCRADASVTDGFNFHNTNAAASMNVLTVNCTGANNGNLLGATGSSNNGWTSHDTVVGIDICGYYDGNHGGTCRSINTSKSWFLRTAVKEDRGDITYGGSIWPTAFRTDDTAVYWCERTKVLMPAGGYGYVTTSGATIHKRSCEPCGLPDYAVGTIDTF